MRIRLNGFGRQTAVLCNTKCLTNIVCPTKPMTIYIEHYEFIKRLKIIDDPYVSRTRAAPVV